MLWWTLLGCISTIGGCIREAVWGVLTGDDWPVKGPWAIAVFGGARGEETSVLRERGAPLGGDSSLSSREDSLLAKGVALR